MISSETLDSEFKYCGPLLGEVEILQYKCNLFNAKCDSRQVLAENDDNTGLRVHSGSSILIRFIAVYSVHFEKTTVIELGCGTGIGSICLNKVCCPLVSIVTDGNEEAVQLAESNCMYHFPRQSNHFPRQLHDEYTIQCLHLSWTNEEVMHALNVKYTSSLGFNYIIACELMYYCTNPIQLVHAVHTLAHPDNCIFLHSHLFRVTDQFQSLVFHFDAIGWISIVVHLNSFISDLEMSEHPEFTSMKMIVSGTPVALATYLKSTSISEWSALDEAYFRTEDSYSVNMLSDMSL